MSDVYENCPAFENDKFLLRFSQLDDAEGIYRTLKSLQESLQ